MARNPKIEFDKLQLYFGEPYTVDTETSKGSITLLQPKIGDIVRIGEKKFYSTLNTFLVNTTSYRLPLWRAGIDWNEMSDYELFFQLLPSCDQEILDLLFEDLKLEDLTLLKDQEKEDSGKFPYSIYNEKNDYEINEEVYHHVSQFFRNIFNTFPEEKLTTQRIMKEWFIKADEREERNKETLKQRGKETETSIQSIISACVNHPGFKYSVHELMNVGVCEFYDSVQRLQIYEQSTALMKGMYSGFVDGSKIKPESYNFMKEIK